jgi:hypothetical protein
MQAKPLSQQVVEAQQVWPAAVLQQSEPQRLDCLQQRLPCQQVSSSLQHAASVGGPH